ncbi:poly(U)-specific endoribonuclease-B-like isoform X1 [Actinia tenebrosa]|uniref:Uridylate-specific endoribonuclease n=1 Tax=Actinia tenebrosa TaxID=6105 RepID=A0A6P8IQ25_ACTTE|nr:poly(U)-specific endoribonuclease-B-like isoform X1 [Actinia tenebrosa]
MAKIRSMQVIFGGLLGCFSVRFVDGSHDIGSICQTLWNADNNSLVNGVDFQLNLQKQLRYSNRYDMASRKLFLRVNEQKLKSPTFVAFKALLDNYVRKTGITESSSSQEKSEISRFLTVIMGTKPIKALHKYLVLRRKAPTSESSFKHTLKVMWFYFYRRKAYRDSSGFEHVFLGEIKTKKRATKTSGFHNWLQFYLEEKQNSVNYYGFFRVKKNTAPVQVKLQLSWHNYLKPVTSFFLGTSPEFEIGLYTACFVLRPNRRCTCAVNGQTIAIQSYTYSKKYVGSAYPIV